MKHCTEENDIDQENSKATCTLSLVSHTQTSPVLELAARPILIGRARDCDIVLRDPCISAYHAQIYCRHGRYFIVDLESTNGTVVNGQSIGRFPQLLKPRDLISICVCQLEFQLRKAPSVTSADQFILATRRQLDLENRRRAVRLPGSIVHWLRQLAAASARDARTEMPDYDRVSTGPGSAAF